MILYAGSYTERLPGNQGGHGEGIYTLDFDPDTGTLTLVGTTPAINPTYLSIPSPEFLYTHRELVEADSPRIEAYRIDPKDHSLHLVSEQPVPGGYPCHVSYSKTHHCILEACYETGNVVIYPIGNSGGLLAPAAVLQHEGSGVNPHRQERAHTHAVLVDETADRLLVTDLGIDRLMIYENSGQGGPGGFTLTGQVVFPEGSGPRHIAVHPGGEYLFVVSEMTSTVGLLRYHQGTVELLGVYQTVGEGFGKEPAAAAIRVSQDGRYVYASERADGHIAILRFDEAQERLELITRVDTGGDTPRDFIFDPSGRWILVANQESDAIAVFSVDSQSGGMELSHPLTGIKSPVCLAWWPGDQ